jgi:hypothetical protein
MIYLKSFGVGLLASVCGGLITIVALLAYVQVGYHVRTLGMDLSVIRSEKFLLLVVSLFILGFVIEFLRLQRGLR